MKTGCKHWNDCFTCKFTDCRKDEEDKIAKSQAIERDIEAYRQKYKKQYWKNNKKHLMNSRRFYRRKMVDTNNITPLFSVIIDGHRTDIYSGRDDYWYFDYKGRYYEITVSEVCRLREQSITVDDAVYTLGEATKAADPFVKIAYNKVQKELLNLEHYRELVDKLDSGRDSL